MRIATVWGGVMSGEKYRLRSRIPMEWYSMLTTVDSSEKESQGTKKKGEKSE